MKKGKGLMFLIMFGLLAMFSGEAKARDSQSYTLAVPTQTSNLETHQSWEPFLERLSKQVGAEIRLKVYDTVPQYEADVMSGIPDFAFMNPYLVVATKQKIGYIPFLRDKNPLIGILVVKQDASAQSVQDLNDKQIAFPSPNAFAASLYMRALLAEREKIKFTPKYAKTHSSVYGNVILGMTAAGSGINKSLMKEKEAIKSQLRILYKTPAVASHPLSAHPRVSPTLRKAIYDAMMQFAKDDAGRVLLKRIQMPEPMKADYESDYASLEKLHLDKFFVQGSE